MTIDETKIEESITPKTEAILATHVFGNPCNIDAITTIAQKHNLKVIYDAAHCFGVQYNGKSIFHYGDISTCSFHATKLFQTGEGGAVFCDDSTTLNKLFYHHNFGHKGKEAFQGLGINAKMSELQAAMGLAVLTYIQKNIRKREEAVAVYTSHLENKLDLLKIREGTDWNASYFPILFKNEVTLLRAVETLNKHNIYPRRYFYPSLDTLPYIKNMKCPVSRNVASRILCLPLFESLDLNTVRKICDLITRSL